jgi:2-polyprenyl-3-methyl-5-hydroxy-6-metoxy-1,4-benzoquinol methylase
MANFNKMYSEDKKAWRDDVSSILISALSYVKGGRVLDLGCAQGKESLFLCDKGFNVVAVDSSSVAIEQLKTKVKKDKLENIEAIESDVVDFKIEKDKYDLIICFNVLYFLKRAQALKVIKDIQDGLRMDGIVAMSLFTVQDPFYNKEKKERFYVETDQIKRLFSKFEILDYFDGTISDSGHASLPEPHSHGVVKLIAKK